MGKEVGGRLKREGAYVFLWLIHVNVWQKPTQFFKAIILQFKIKKNFFKDSSAVRFFKKTLNQGFHEADLLRNYSQEKTDD